MKYICEFQIPVENDEGRYYALSAVDKASYIHDVLVRLGHSVEIISPAYAKKTSRKRIDYINDKICVISGFSLGWRNSLTKVFSRISAMLWLFFYLINNCEKGEKVIIYHGVQNIPVFLLAKKIVGFDVVLELEEIYSSLLNKDKNWRQKLEYRMICSASFYIFASEILEQTYNIGKKPYAIAYGAYKVPPLYSEKANDGKMHIVYAGLIKKDKVAFKSARIAKYLSSNYHVHIIGYGEQYDIDELNKEIDEIKKDTECVISYDGLKRGEEYLSFLQSCHIGICPLTNDNTFQLACFPSKITSYLTNGLEVITTENTVLRNSQYKPFLHFVKDDAPESFAKVISNQNQATEITPRDYLIKMDKDFCTALGSVV
jgi:hypothetical protein